MFTTKKLYEEHPDLLVCSARVLDVMEENGISVVVLDQTVFRPRDGGGSDIGLIESENKRFHVSCSERREDFIRHIGMFEGDPFETDEMITCTVNEAFRKELAENNQG